MPLRTLDKSEPAVCAAAASPLRRRMAIDVKGHGSVGMAYGNEQSEIDISNRAPHPAHGGKCSLSAGMADKVANKLGGTHKERAEVSVLLGSVYAQSPFKPPVHGSDLIGSQKSSRSLSGVVLS